MKEFEHYLKKGIVRKISVDKVRAEDLIKEAERKFRQFKRFLENIGADDENANDIVEDAHDILLGLIRAKMVLKGYWASGFGAHEAEISFLNRLDFTEEEIDFIQKLRYFRNGIMYYGKRFDKEYAEKVVMFTKTTFQKLKRILNLD